MSAKPCKRDAEERLPVRSLSNRKPKPPNSLLIQDKTFYSLQRVYLECGNSGKSNQTVSILAFVLHRFGVCVHPFTKSQRTW